MSEASFYDRPKVHQDPDGDFLPEPGFGVDRHVIRVPAGKKLTRYDLIKLEGGCKIDSPPPSRATGTFDINVTWWHLPLERARYTLRVFAGTPRPVTVTFGHGPWVDRALQVIDQGLPLNLVVAGPDAVQLWRHLNIHPDVNPGASKARLAQVFNFFDAVPTEAAQDSAFTPAAAQDEDEPAMRIALPHPQFDPSGGAITIAVVAILAATATFGILALVLLKAIEAGYCADTTFEGGNVGSDSISLPKVQVSLKPCRS